MKLLFCLLINFHDCSAGQILFRYRVNAHPNKYLHRFVPVSSFAVFMNNFDTLFKDNIVVFHYVALYLTSEIKKI